MARGILNPWVNLVSARLLRQPDGFEGFGAGGEDMGAADLPVFEVVDAGGPHGGLDALLGSGFDDEEGQNALLDGSCLLDLEFARLRVAPQLVKVVAYAFVPGDRPLPLKWRGEGNELQGR
jgi:hypothetical protein